MNALPIEPRWLGLGLALAVLVIAAVAGIRAYRRRARRRALLARLERIALRAVHQVEVPDGMGGYIHVDHLLLTAQGILLLDTRRIPGLIFGGDQMSEWTVMQRAHRFTFVNPQTGLYDRIAAVRALAPDLPVEGRIVFTPRGRFPKGLPRHTLMLESLPAEFPNTAPDSIRPMLDRWMPTWNVIGKSVAPSRLAAPKPAI